MIHLGHTRGVVRRQYALLTPDTFVRAPLPGFVNATNIVHIGPQLGAAFVQYTAELSSGGRFGPVPAGVSRFVYVTGGTLKLQTAEREASLDEGEYVYLPPGTTHSLTTEKGAVAGVYEKKYQPLEGAGEPWMVVGSEQTAPQRPLGEGGGLAARVLLPEDFAFDLAVTTMTYAPGATLPFVEIHSMEHGLLMLRGEGIYLLGQDHLPVRQGDVIYMAPYCPQWMVGAGAGEAKYLLYKDWNRHPLAT